MSAAPAKPAKADDAAKEPANKGGKKKLIVIALAVLLAAGGGGGYMFYAKSKAAAEAAANDDDGQHAPKKVAKKAHVDKGAPPVFLPLDPFVVNIADEETERYLQLGITLQLDDPKIAEDMKVYMPAIRNAILLLLSQRTAEQMLAVQGKEDLSQDIIAEVSAIMGYDYEDPREAAEEAPSQGKKPKRKRAVYNPIAGVLFSSFIVQ